MKIVEDQRDYWNKVAHEKTFTHPLNVDVLKTYLPMDSFVSDYGCGYGRTVKELLSLGYPNVSGHDTSKELINRGRAEDHLPIYHMECIDFWEVPEESLDGIILFAVLTCIPSNEGQKNLIEILYSKLKKGGILYISDYYLQHDPNNKKDYSFFNNDPNNYGVFSSSDGAILRHHTPEWIQQLLIPFKILQELEIDVFTMNGNSAKGFQMIVEK